MARAEVSAATAGEPRAVESSQQPEPSPWSRSGNARFKRRTGRPPSRKPRAEAIEPRNYYNDEEADAVEDERGHEPRNVDAGVG